MYIKEEKKEKENKPVIDDHQSKMEKKVKCAHFILSTEEIIIDQGMEYNRLICIVIHNFNLMRLWMEKMWGNLLFRDVYGIQGEL